MQFLYSLSKLQMFLVTCPSKRDVHACSGELTPDYCGSILRMPHTGNKDNKNDGHMAPSQNFPLRTKAVLSTWSSVVWKMILVQTKQESVEHLS